MLCNCVSGLHHHVHRKSPGKRADPRDPHAQTGPSPGSGHQRRKGLFILFTVDCSASNTTTDYFVYFDFSEERPSLHHPSVSWGPALRVACMVLPDLLWTQGHGAPADDLAVPDGDDPPPARQQPCGAAGGDQDDTGGLLPAPQLEPSARQRGARPTELGRQSDLAPEPNAK